MEEFLLQDINADHYQSVFQIWVQADQLETFKREWIKVVTMLAEVGVLDGWVDSSACDPHIAYLSWKDKSSWQSYRQHCHNPVFSNPVKLVASQMQAGAIIGFETVPPKR